MQGVSSNENNNNNTSSSSSRRWTPEDKDKNCNGIADYKYHGGRAMQKVQSQSKCILQLETEIHRSR